MVAWDPLARMTDAQVQKLQSFELLLRDFNRRVNLISREDDEAVFNHHILHSLSLAYKSFPDGAVVVDWGTGGGLPAIPLAIAFPGVQFVGVDSVGKKAQAVRAMARRLDLANVDVWKGRAEKYDGMLDFSVSRAAAPLAELWSWHARSSRPVSRDSDETSWRKGLVCLKGGDLMDERIALPQTVHVAEVRLDSLFRDAYFKRKVILECSLLHAGT